MLYFDSVFKSVFIHFTVNIYGSVFVLDLLQFPNKYTIKVYNGFLLHGYDVIIETFPALKRFKLCLFEKSFGSFFFFPTERRERKINSLKIFQTSIELKT